MATDNNFYKLTGERWKEFMGILKGFFWKKADTVDAELVDIDNTPTANSNNLVKSGGVKSYVDSVIPTVPTALSQLSDDSTHRLVTDTEKGTWNGKQNALTFDNTPTANSNNPVKSGGVYSTVYPAVQSTRPSGGMLPNVPYSLGTLTGTISLTLASPTDASIRNEYTFDFNTGSTAPTLTLPAGITWVGSCVNNGSPVISASKHYEVSIIGTYGKIEEF